MDILVAEIAGKDSVAAVHKIIRMQKTSEIIPSIVYTRTEYGGFEAYYKSIDYLRQFAHKKNCIIRKIHHISNEQLWNLVCVKYQYQLYKKYGFYTPCIMCHLCAHLLRIPLCYQYGAQGLITGERYSHGGKIKLNQHARTMECFRNLMAYAGIVLVQPLLDYTDSADVDSEIGNEMVIEHANDTKCILSGNLNEYVVKEEMLQAFLDEYVYPIGKKIIDTYKKSDEISYDILDQYVRGLFDGNSKI